MKMRISLVLLVLGLSALVAAAQSVSGMGKNFGSGWSSDGHGGYQGTGKNFGSGWSSDGRGGLQGTGKNFGRGWSSD